MADLGIGRHKSNEDLIKSLETAENNLREQGIANAEITSTLFEGIKLVIRARATSNNTFIRALEPFYNGTCAGLNTLANVGKDIVMKPFESGTNRAAVATGTAGAALGGILAVSAAPIAASALGFGVAGATAYAGGKGAYDAVQTTFTSLMTINDGYDHLLDHAKLLYFARRQFIEYAQKKKCEIKSALWIGHSLGGYLATFGAILNEEEAVVYNSPGIQIEETLTIASDAGLITIEDAARIRSNREAIALKLQGTRMATCTIAQLGTRDGNLAELSASGSHHFVTHRRNLRRVHGQLKKLTMQPSIGAIILEHHSMRNLMIALHQHLEYEGITSADWNQERLQERKNEGQERVKKDIYADLLRKQELILASLLRKLQEFPGELAKKELYANLLKKQELILASLLKKLKELPKALEEKELVDAPAAVAGALVDLSTGRRWFSMPSLGWHYFSRKS